MKQKIFGLLLAMMCGTATAEQWFSYPTVESVSRVAVMHDKAFVVSGNTLCVADTANITNYTALSKLNGLTGISVFDIRYSKNTDRLAVVYTDGNIDLLTSDDKIIPIPDLANNVGAQSHYPTQIAVRNDSLYVQTSTTLLTVDMKKALICRSTNQLVDLAPIDDPESHSDSLVKTLNGNLDENQNWVKTAASMKLIDGRLITTQSMHFYYGVLSGDGHISILNLEDNTWSQINRVDVEDKVKAMVPEYYRFRNILSVGKDEANPSRYYISCDGTGIYEFTADTLSDYFCSKNCPQGITPIVDQYSRVSDVHADAEGNLWVVCAGINETQLRCRTASGQWFKTQITGFTNKTPGNIEMRMSRHANMNFIWLVRNYSWDEFGGAVYYRNDTGTSTKQDQSVFFSSLVDQDGNAINPQYLYDAVEDLDGKVWLLTSMGPFIVDNQVEFFNYALNKTSPNIGKVRRVKIPRNDGSNLADYLLNNVETVCGLVDAANNKWIGTSNDGIYHLSSDGLIQLEHFTTDNSPLFSNAIQSLEYDENTGRLYIATAGGLCVYQTDAIKGAPDNKQIYCYPNPVRPGYSGKLYICNLQDQSDIRITDTTGHVIYQTKTYGGQTSWDLRNNAGDRVKPGIYYIYSIDDDGKEGGVTKCLVQ